MDKSLKKQIQSYNLSVRKLEFLPIYSQINLLQID